MAISIRFTKPTLTRKDMDAVLQTMVDEKIGPGEKKREFVKLFSAFIGSKDGIVLRSFSDVIAYSLSALNLEKGSTIALSLFSPKIYEYVIKSYLLTGGISSPMLRYYLKVVRDIKKGLVFHTLHQNLTGIASRAGAEMEPTMEHLATFAGGMLAIGTVIGNEQAVEDLELAGQLATTFATVYKTMKSGVMAEQMKYNARNPAKDKDFWVHVDEYILRPESVESVYLMWKFTGLQKYRDYAWEMFKGINRSCRVPGGFAAITGVDSDRVRHRDSMESFFLAETLKYLYLIFSDSSLISPTEWVFNTEAHPVRMWDKDTIEKFRKLVTDLPT